VGANGAGKSTVAKLLCRFYDPVCGVIRLDGVDLRAVGTSDLRRNIAALFQDFGQYAISVRQNIWFGDIEADAQAPRLEEMAEDLGLGPIIKRLPGGYEQMLGRQFQGGEQLSAGQWQRLALARTLLRDAGILILDEPTAAIPPDDEARLLELIRQRLDGRTAVLISHRPAATRLADWIYVLRDGEVVEEGDHGDLMARGGDYAELFDLQRQRQAV